MCVYHKIQQDHYCCCRSTILRGISNQRGHCCCWLGVRHTAVVSTHMVVIQHSRTKAGATAYNTKKKA